MGVAIFVSAPLGLFLISTFGLSRTLLILGCTQAQLIVIGTICKPSVIEKEVQINKKIYLKTKENSVIKSYIDLSLLTKLPFLLFLISISAWNFGITVASMHLPNYVSIMGGSAGEIAVLMTSFSIANLTGRVLGSLTVSKFNEMCLKVNTTVLGIAGVLTSLFVFYSRLKGGSFLFALQLGLFTGWPNSMMTPLSVRFVGVSKLSEAYGLAYLFCGFGVSTGPVLISK